MSGANGSGRSVAVRIVQRSARRSGSSSSSQLIGTETGAPAAGRGLNGEVLVYFWEPGPDWRAVNVTADTGYTTTTKLTAWQVPDGPYNGTFFFAPGAGPDRLREVLGGVSGLGVHIAADEVTWLGEKLWKGKVFYRDQMELRNMIEDRSAVAKIFGVKESDMRTTVHDGKTVGLLFPAKLYCGQSLLDSRRESVIIDYAFGDEIEGYLDGVDKIAGRNGLQVRDEIRRIRPGFYLGRAYMGRVFVLNFTLFSPEVAQRGLAAAGSGGAADDDEDCWPGHEGAPAARAAS